MRVTQNNFYNRFVANQQMIKQQLNRLSMQISSGTKIQYGYENPQVFTDTLRLDYEEHALNQAVDTATDAQNFANNTDSVMFQFTDALTRFKTLLIQAANGTNENSNFFAISNELKSLKEHFINLGNSSVNGRFLFSGSKLDKKPLDGNGDYHGNGASLKAVVGAKVEVPYNIPGLDLFFGEDGNVNRTVTTNVALRRKDGDPVTAETTLEEITGSTNDFTFTVQGRTSEGDSVSQTFPLSATATVQDLLDGIENVYGSGQVDVRLINGYIEVRDNKEGSSLLDMHLYGLENGGSGSIAFVKTDGVAADNYASAIPFEKRGDGHFRGNMPQIVKADGSYANGSTKLQETSSVDLTGGRTLELVVNGNASTISIDENYTYAQLFEALKSTVSGVTGKPTHVSIDHSGHLNIESEGLESFSLYDNTSPSVLFQTNDALTVDDPKHDFFAAIDSAIEAVEKGATYPDGEATGSLARNPGIENAIARIDHVLAHVDKEHTKIGAMSNSLKYAVERNETLKINVQTLRSEVLDTDIGEATMRLNQLSLNFQALMASVSKVQNLSLVNYL